MHCPRAPTPEPCNKERAPTQEPAGALKTKGVTARVSGLCSVLTGRAGFSFSGSSPGPVLASSCWSCVPGPFRRLAVWRLVSGCVVSRPGGGQKFEEQAGADPITELSSGTPWDAVADMVWGYFITDTILERLGYVLHRLRLLCRLSHGLFRPCHRPR